MNIFKADNLIGIHEFVNESPDRGTNDNIVFNL